MEEENSDEEIPENQVEKKETKSNLLKKLPQNYWMVASIILGIILIIIIISGGITGGAIGVNDAGQAVLNYAQLLGINDTEILNVLDEGSFYEVEVSTGDGQGSLFITKDGKYHIQPISLLKPETQTNTNTNPQPTQEIPKSDKPTVDLYVMSFCPYGNEAENTMQPVYNLLKNNINFNVHYIVSVSGDKVQSLHGQPEVDQNIREICVLKNNGLDKWWDFTLYVNENCGSDGSCWEQAASKAGLTSSSISSCVSSQGLELMQAEATASNQAGANGSPTLIINGVKTDAVYNYRDSETYKQAICSAFNTAPEACSNILSSSTSTNTGGSC